MLQSPLTTRTRLAGGFGTSPAWHLPSHPASRVRAVLERKMTKAEKKAAYMKAWRQENKAEIAANGRVYAKAHKVEIAAYRAAHKKEKAKYQKAYCAKNKDRITAYNKARYAKNKDERRTKYKAYCVENKDKIATRQKVWYEENKAASAKRYKAWRKANLDKMADKEARRRARKRGAFVEEVDRTVVYERDGGRCHICGNKVPKGNWHLDHIIPLERGLVRGGEHSYRNVAVSCPACNIRKGIKAGGQLRLL